MAYWRICPCACKGCSKMSQSDVHRELVIQVVAELEGRYPRISVVSDLQKKPGDPVPPMIDGFRPDVYAKLPANLSASIIAEAKTDKDIDKSHTYSQITAFINYLERRSSGSFILATTGHGADLAKTTLQFLYHNVRSANTKLSVYDGCDLWSLDSISGATWHLI